MPAQPRPQAPSRHLGARPCHAGPRPHHEDAVDDDIGQAGHRLGPALSCIPCNLRQSDNVALLRRRQVRHKPTELGHEALRGIHAEHGVPSLARPASAAAGPATLPSPLIPRLGAPSNPTQRHRAAGTSLGDTGLETGGLMASRTAPLHLRPQHAIAQAQQYQCMECSSGVLGNGSWRACGAWASVGRLGARPLGSGLDPPRPTGCSRGCRATSQQVVHERHLLESQMEW